MRFLWFMVRPKIGWALLAMLAVTFAQVLASASPYLLKLITEGALAGDTQAVIFWALLFPVIEGFMYISWRTSGFLGLHFITQSTKYGYNALFQHLTLHSDAYFSSRFAGSLSNKLGRAINRTEGTIENILWHYYSFLIQFSITTVLICMADVRAGAIFFVSVLLLFLLNYFLVKWRRPYVVAYADSDSTLSGRTVDTISNIRAMHHFARRRFEVLRIDEQLEDRRIKDFAQWKISEIILIINNAIIVAATAGIIFFTVMQWQAGGATTGDLVLVLSLLAQISGSLTFIGSTMNGFIRNYGETEEGLEAILLDHDIVDAPDARELSVSEGAIAFDKITFHYSDAEVNAVVFDFLDVIVPAHQKVGLVGESGAGKSTLVSLLMRQHDVIDGAITIDGQNSAEVTQESLRKNIAMVPQEPLLFHRTIKENIQYGNLEATDEEVIRAAKMARAHEFICETPNGYDTLVGERGVKLSGGQRQRIAIARAILKDAPILVLDEATSALDSESEVLIQKALHELMQGKTVIAIAHRLSTLREMDRIIVMERGMVAQDGTHDELVAQEGIYKRLWEHQAGGFLKE